MMGVFRHKYLCLLWFLSKLLLMLKAGSLNYSIVNERVAGYLIYICFLNKKISRLKFIIKLSALKNVFMLRLTRKKKREDERGSREHHCKISQGLQ